MKYKLCDYTHHVMHQSDMYWALKDDVEVDFILNSWREWQRPEFLAARSIPENIKFVSYYEEGKYDAAILHVDQQSIRHDIFKGEVYRQFNETIKDIPKIVINHGTPVYPEYTQLANMSSLQAQKVVIDEIRKLIGDNIMVVNSHTSASEKEWGWGVPIVHGMNPNNWYDLPKEPRVFTALSPGGLDEYYNRDCMNQVKGWLHDLYGRPLFWAKVNIDTHVSQEFYKTFLGSSLVYLDTSFRTPMNRARTEAMLSGACIVQVEGAHDIDRWGKHGENMIIVPNRPKEIAMIVNNLIENRYAEAVEIGRRGREMALKEFSPERYRQDWLKLLKQVTKK